ncbi:pentapeptide repeat-containing protein [Dongshaea marina]|uniref:pentapeptide repeat-containing protein n=1 Tax=Dongshaea marina TaxID=2047966 RepID=UPI001F2E090A|nr:pentapeptide repeat-containing protein [Dongshaea marina]
MPQMAAVKAEAEEQKAKAKLLMAQGKKKLADVPKLFQFKLDQVKGKVPSPRPGMQDIGPVMSQMLDQRIEQLVSAKPRLSQFANEKTLANLDRSHANLLKMRKKAGSQPAKLARAQRQMQQMITQTEQQLEQPLKQSHELAKRPDIIEAQQRLTKMRAEYSEMYEGPKTWAGQASRLVGLGILNRAKFITAQSDQLGLRSMSCQRYLIGYLSKAEPFIPQEWELDEPAERDYIGPGWLFSEYQKDKFVGLTVRPERLDNRKGEYRVQGSGDPVWISGPEEDDAPAVVVDEQLTAYLLAQDVDDSIRVVLAESSDSEGAKKTSEANPLLIPVAFKDRDDESLLEPWLKVNQSAKLWPLPEESVSLHQFTREGKDARDWLKPYLREDKSEAPSYQDFEKAMKKKMTGGMEIEDYFEHKQQQNFALMEENSHKISSPKGREDALKSVQDLKNKFAQDKVNPQQIDTIAAMQKGHQHVKETCDKVGQQFSELREAGHKLPEKEVGKALQRNQRLKNAMQSMHDELQPFVKDMLDKKPEIDQKIADLKSDPKLTAMKYRKLTRSELEQAYAKGESLKRLDLKGMDLKGINLSGADLSDSILQDADFTGADLNDCKLHSVIAVKIKLNGSNLERADLTKAIMNEAELNQCHAEGAIWDRALLKEAKFTGANLKQGRFFRTLLERAELNNTHLEHADLKSVYALKANLEASRLNGSQLEKAVMLNAILSGADFRDAKGFEANMWGAQAQEADFRKTFLPKLRLGPAKLHKAKLQGSQMQYLNLMGGDANLANFEGAALDRAYMDSAKLTQCNLRNTDMSWANLTCCNLEGADLKGADLMYGRLKKVRMTGADLTTTNFFGADLTKLVLGKAKLSGTNFKRTVLAGQGHMVEEINQEVVDEPA